MFISMQGNWTISVKSISASFPQRFKVSSADTGNGIYDAAVGMKPVQVTGEQWTIAILNDPGTGFQLSETRLKTPILQGGEYRFDIESNDAGGDQDFNDLILTCSTPALIDDFIIYGHVTLYSGDCLFNPCYRNWLVIDTYPQLIKLLDIPHLKEIIKQYYPERIPPLRITPNPPDPAPDFTPMMIHLVEESQIPPPKANIFQRRSEAVSPKKGEEKNEMALSHFSFQKQVTVASQSFSENIRPVVTSERIQVAKIIDQIRWHCTTEPGKQITLNFEEYDRTTSELAGGNYTGLGNRTTLGSAVTDSNGNYIFRFKQTFSELINEILQDVGAGENVFVQWLPDIIVKIKDTFHPSVTLFESAPYYNVAHLKRIDFCLPASLIPVTDSLCFNGNMVGSLGNIFIGGSQNTSGSFSVAALDRNGYNNHLHADGVITVHNAMAGFGVDCACWSGTVDVKGCLFNLQRKKGDPIVRYYTIRFMKPGGSWQYVNETYLHPRFSKRFIPHYHGDMVGPFPTDLHVDGGPLQHVPAYINIQARTFFDGEDWEFTNLDRYMQLQTGIYENGNPGTVYFRIDGYDEQGKPVPGATDLIALFINNKPLNFGLGSIEFTDPSIEYIACGLYRMTSAQMNTPLEIQFKASDAWGFIDHYTLTIGKCPNSISLDITSPPSLIGTVTNGILAHGENAGNTDAHSPSCPGYRGTLQDFATSGYVNVIVQPSASEGGWLRPEESYVVVSGSLVAVKRETNGYNSGYSCAYCYYHTFSFAIERKA
ncbi:hypothetical protein [Thermoflavifilum thermophilum]|uniref:Uncharacterized protein n=1 Tax=Thermoflavifilum thermophilum TaxID=1393122 RepID=A0A1I7N9Z1_9BACT|nr:hypothetical protein [Thermoflavifilum thermophilum]SFV31492.1 hypothetical protein SAMN05660895_1091 [Thermoflavifilum thermophilum]